MNLPLQSLGKLMVVIGVGLAVVGLFFIVFGDKGTLPRLPGDLVLKKKNLTIYLPIGTSILVSLLLTLFLWFLNRR